MSNSEVLKEVISPSKLRISRPDLDSFIGATAEEAEPLLLSSL